MANVLVTKENLDSCLRSIGAHTRIGFDTETTGLFPYLGDRLFALQISTPENNYYFNYNKNGDVILERGTIERAMSAIRSDALVFAHNAKFDLHMVGRDIGPDWCPTFTVHDTEVIDRLFYNQHPNYKLSSLAERAGLEKLSDVVEDYISQNGLYETVCLPGGKEERKPLYSEVPFPLMFEYGCRDVEITLKLGLMQWERILKTTWKQSNPGFPKPYEIEYGMTKVLFDMERHGVLVDQEYSKKAFDAGTEELRTILSEFQTKFGHELVDSAESLGPLLTDRGVKLKPTAKGNLSIANWVLEDYPNDEMCVMLLRYRDVLKRTNTYFGNFLRFSDTKGVVHCNFRQAGTGTGRLSASDPNLQNVSKEDTSDTPIRRALLAFPDSDLLELDYAAQEFRMVLDYANEVELADRIKGGHDPHQATADMSGLSRKQAKTLNFAVLYGVGAAKLSGMLGVDLESAKLFKARYFRALPGVKRFIYAASDVAKIRGYVMNWNGRPYHYPDSKFSYRAANAIIQGGSSEVVKVAMCRIYDYLNQTGLKSRLLLQVHDSIVLKLVRGEEHIIPELQRIMRESYPSKILGMDTTVELSPTTWYDLQKHVPPTGGQVQSSSHDSPPGAA